jgi:hypothetical protein
VRREIVRARSSSPFVYNKRFPLTSLFVSPKLDLSTLFVEIEEYSHEGGVLFVARDKAGDEGLGDRLRQARADCGLAWDEMRSWLAMMVESPLVS